MPTLHNNNWLLPDLSLLTTPPVPAPVVAPTTKKPANKVVSSSPSQVELEGHEQEEEEANLRTGKIIEAKLARHGVEATLDQINVGPALTQYAYRLGDVTKIAQVSGLLLELELELVASPITLSSPVLGKSLVGIRVPNQVRSRVELATFLCDNHFVDNKAP